MRHPALSQAFIALLAAGTFAGCGPERPSTGEPILLGSGDYVFEWVRDWAKLPEGMQLGYTHGRIVIDAQGHVYVETETENAVCVFDSDGNFLKSFAPQLAGGLHGMAIVREDAVEYLYLTHIRKGEVYKTTLDGEVLWTLGWPQQSGLYPKGAGQYHPTSVAVAPNGDVYVADGYGLSYIHRYDRERRYLGSFGGLGAEPGQLRNPHGIWIQERDGKHTLIVADRENRRVQLFDLEGNFLELWTEGIRRPCFLQPRGDLLAMADIDGKVTLLDREGEVLVHLGENHDPEARDIMRPEQLVDGVFVSPHGLCWAPDGSLYIIEWLEHGRITKLIPRS